MTDPELREQFARLRKADHAAAPDFRETLRRARHAKASQTHPRTSTPWYWAAGLATAVFAIVALSPVFKPKPSLAQTLPVLLKTETAPQPIFTHITDSHLGSGSDFLLTFRLDLASL